MGPQTGPGFVKCYPNAPGPSITSFMVASPQDPGKCALCPLPHLLPITRVLRHLSGAVLFCHYHCTVYKSKTHFFFFLISVYSGITPNTTNSFFPCISQEKKKKAKIHTKMACATSEPPQNNPKIFFQTALSFGTSELQTKVEQL